MFETMYRWLRKKTAPGETYPECPAMSAYRVVPDFFEVSTVLDTTLKDGTYTVKEEDKDNE